MLESFLSFKCPSMGTLKCLGGLGIFHLHVWKNNQDRKMMDFFPDMFFFCPPAASIYGWGLWPWCIPLLFCWNLLLTLDSLFPFNFSCDAILHAAAGAVVFDTLVQSWNFSLEYAFTPILCARVPSLKQWARRIVKGLRDYVRNWQLQYVSTSPLTGDADWRS